MTFEEGGLFSAGRVQTRQAGKTAAVSGGVGGTVLLAIMGMALGDRDGTEGIETALTSGQIQLQPAVHGVVGECSAVQANTDVNCQLSATAQSLDAFWRSALPDQTDFRYTPPAVVSYSGVIDTPCGEADGESGPFYCPSDEVLYLDVEFFDSLAHDYGAGDTDLAREYVVAHEFGHHIQQLLGVMGATDRSGSGIDSGAVRIELQADCYAGMWARAASQVIDPNTGIAYLKPLTDQQVNDALQAAASVGDDHIADLLGEETVPDTFTHGTSVQRRAWFMQGYDYGSVDLCDAVNAKTLGRQP